jgi:transcriptional antiterminator RfaH
MSTAIGGELRWYLIQCKPREDRRALENLQRQSFECFHPTRQVERRRDGRRYAAAEPLFPSYLFVHLNCASGNWYPIRSTRGVQRIVCFNGEPQSVPNEIVEGVRTRLAAHTDDLPYLRPGERVRIVDGAFSQLEAIFVANEGIERVVLLLDILQKDQKLSFPLKSVRKLG